MYILLYITSIDISLLCVLICTYFNHFLALLSEFVGTKGPNINSK